MSSATSEDVVESLAAEIAWAVDRAVECWIAEIDCALTDPHLTTLGRLNAARDVITRYKNLTGKIHVEERGVAGGTDECRSRVFLRD